ncbi:MAG: hypothetical protein AB9866_08520 [Syntrophobacteraceae bacterium]
MKQLHGIVLCLLTVLMVVLFGTANVLATEVLFVVGAGDLGASDLEMKAHLKSHGFKVTIQRDSLVGSYDAAGKDLVLISGSVTPSRLGTMFRDLNEPVVCLHPGLFDDLGMTGEGPKLDYGYSARRKEMVIVPGHPLAASLSGKIQVQTRLLRMGWGVPGQEAITVGVLEDGSPQSTIFAYEAETAMPGLVAPAKRVGFFIAPDGAPFLTKAGWALFDAAVEWSALQVPEDLSAVQTSVAAFMGWGKTAPNFTKDVAYQSSDAWEDPAHLPAINFEPSHYPHFTNGKVTFANGTALADTTFQQALENDFPPWQEGGPYINYIQGNPEITVETNLRQLKAAGFKAVRLYASPPQVYIPTILAAHKLNMKVYLEVAAPDLSKAPYATGNNIKARQQALFNDLVRQAGPGVGEGSVQCLHYIINAVGKSVFSQTVVLIFFTHENLVSPTTTVNQTLTDANCSVPELRWGVNLLRSLLIRELAGEPLPAVTTPILAGQVVQVSLKVHPEISKLIRTIRTDKNAPIAYDNYPFQWGIRYFNTFDPYINKPAFVIPNAYPPNSHWIDKCMVNGVKWVSGDPPIAPLHSIRETVLNKDLMFSLNWIVDSVNWIWGGRKKGAKVKQIMAETGWPTAQFYQNGTRVTGNLADAKQYFNAVKIGNGGQRTFMMDNCPIVYFSAYDEPIKESNAYPNMFSENHYGIYGWSGIPKFFAESTLNPLLQPFTILGIVPANPLDGIPRMRLRETLPTDARYSYSLNGDTAVDVPWYAGVNILKGGGSVGSSICWLPNHDILLSTGDSIVIRNPSSPNTITLKSDDGSTVAYQNPDDKIKTGSNLTSVSNPYGTSWKLWLSYPWDHGGQLNPTSQNEKVYSNWWAQ